MSGVLKDAEELARQMDSTCKGLESEENVSAGWLTLSGEWLTFHFQETKSTLKEVNRESC